MTVQAPFRASINRARGFSGVPYKINSGARCKKHNASKDVQGSPTSSHLEGIAADIAYTTEANLIQIVAGLVRAGFTRIGVNAAKKFIHVDSAADKPDAIWDYAKGV
jgi:hypothetical protein